MIWELQVTAYVSQFRFEYFLYKCKLFHCIFNNSAFHRKCQNNYAYLCGLHLKSCFDFLLHQALCFTVFHTLCFLFSLPLHIASLVVSSSHPYAMLRNNSFSFSGVTAFEQIFKYSHFHWLLFILVDKSFLKKDETIKFYFLVKGRFLKLLFCFAFNFQASWKKNHFGLCV